MYNYPTTFLHGCNRRFKPDWCINHPWLHYSLSEDGVFCKACALFAPDNVHSQKLGMFVSKPFRVWTKQSSTFHSHEHTEYHQNSMARMVAFQRFMHCPTQNVACMLNKEHEAQVSQNIMVLKSLFDCVCFCAKQGISFRGHRDDNTATGFR